MEYNQIENTAKTYYDSDDADRFYSLVWGGEDIHVGLYDSPDISIHDASRKTVEKMVSLLDDKPRKVIDLGSGYGGSARHLAKTHGCHVDCLNISEVENRKNRKRNSEEGLDKLIDVKEGSFESVPFPDSSFDLVWSQDAILHSGNKEKVFSEISRVLQPGGILIFTDPMQKHGVSSDELRPVLDRIHLDSMGSFEYYNELAGKYGLEKSAVIDLSEQLVNHYSRVKAEIENRYDEIKAEISESYLQKMKTGLEHWVTSGKKGLLGWGIMKYRKV